MSSTSELQEEIFYEQNVASEQKTQNNDQFTIIVPFIASKQQQSQSSQHENSSLGKFETNYQIDHQENQSEENTDNKINQNNNADNYKVLTFHKEYRQLSSQNSDNNQNDQKNYNNIQESSQNTSKQDSLVEILPQKSFNRTNLKNHRRSLHVITGQNEENRKNRNINDELIFTKKNKRVISQQNTYRRYAQQDVNNSESQKDLQIFTKHLNKQQKFRKTHITSMNNKSFGSNVSSKRHQSQSLSKLDQQDLFNHPERNSQRVVVFLKTYIISPFQSVSIEVSHLKNSLIIVANLLGEQKQTVKMILNQEKTQKLFKESYNDWQILGKRIFLEMTPSGGKRIKISPIKQMMDFVKLDLKKDKIEFPKQQLSRNFMTKMKQEKKRQIYIRQKQFIRRNYYSIVNKAQNIQKTVNQNSTSNENTLNNTQKHKLSTIQTKQMQTKTNFSYNNPRKNLYFNQNKHLDYMSPQVKQEIKNFRNSKQKSLNSENIQKEKLNRQAFLKKQHTFIERLSKSKDTKELKKQNNKSKEKPFVVFKVGSLNNFANSFVPNQRKTRIVSKLKDINLKKQNGQHITVKQANALQKQQKKQYAKKKDETPKSNQSIQKILTEEQNKNKNKNEQKIKLESHQVEIIKIQTSQSSLRQKSILKHNKTEQNKQEQYKFQSSEENISKQSQNQYQEEQFQSENKQKQPSKSNFLQQKRSSKEVKKNDINKESQSQKYSDLIQDIDDQYENQYEEFQQQKPSKVFQQKNKKQKIQKHSEYQQSYQKDFQSQKDQQNLDQEYAFTDEDNQDKVEQQTIQMNSLLNDCQNQYL